jgi:hypothetical protein
MHIKPICRAYFSTALAAISLLCVALCWMPRLSVGSDTAEFNEMAEADVGSAGKLIITTYSGGNEGHLITFPDSTTLGIDCASGAITTLSHYHADHCDNAPHDYNRNNVSLGQVIYNKDGVTVTVVATNGRVIGGVDGNCNSSDENACSMVLWVKYKGFDYLSGGDLTGGKEGPLGDALAARGVQIDVYKVHHHGSRTSSYSPFLEDILPEYAVASGGGTTLHSDTLARLKDAGVRIIYDTSDEQSDPQVKYSGGDIKITTDGRTYSFSAPNFNDGPYGVDEYVPPDVYPPHLMITEVGIGDHKFPENHDWAELYLPLDAPSIDLRSVYVTDLDYVSQVATSPVTLAPGDLAVLHNTFGQSESDATGKGANGYWDLFHPFSGSGNTWNSYNDELVLSTKNTIAPAQADIIDAVVWANDDGEMLGGQVSDGNYLIDKFHWGDPDVGTGLFSTSNEGPAIGDVDNGYPQRIDLEDTNSVSDWRINPNNSQGIPPPTPTPTPAPPPPLDLILNTSSPSQGETFKVSAVVQSITGRPFDAYAVIVGNAGIFSIQPGSRLKRGVVPLVQDVSSLPNGYSGVLLNMSVPQGVEGDYQIIAGLVDAGSKVKGAGSAFAGDTEHFTIR